MRNPTNLVDRRSAVIALLSAAITACSVRTSLKNAGKINEDLKQELGVEANVQVNEVNGKKLVRVVLTEKPALEPEVIRKKVRTVVARHVPDLDELEVFSKL